MKAGKKSRYLLGGSGRRRMEKTGILLAAPALALLVLLFGYPIFFNFYLSFFRLNLYVSTEKTFVGFDNYINVLEDSLFYGALANTTFFAAASVALEFIIGLVLALLLSKIEGIWMRLLGAALMIPMFLSE
ncbi:MAG: carbohydrate ABC transporter permease, partial [Candidatus Bathyarchaeia archaeon]